LYVCIKKYKPKIVATAKIITPWKTLAQSHLLIINIWIVAI